MVQFTINEGGTSYAPPFKPSGFNLFHATTVRARIRRLAGGGWGGHHTTATATTAAATTASVCTKCSLQYSAADDRGTAGRKRSQRSCRS